jgi:hypothetical protein
MIVYLYFKDKKNYWKLWKNALILLHFEASNRYTHLFLVEREYFGFNTLGSVIVE